MTTNAMLGAYFKDAVVRIQAETNSLLPNRFAGDAAEAQNFLVSELVRVESTVYQIPRQPVTYQELVPVNTAGPETLQGILFSFSDVVGRGKRTSGKGDDINVVDEAFAHRMYGVVHGNIGYKYTIEELRIAAAMRRPLDTRRAAIALEAYERHMNRVALRGEAESGLTGLFNSTFVPIMNVAQSWNNAATTPAMILRDFNLALMAYWAQTAYTEMPTTVLLPPVVAPAVFTKPRSDTSDTTVIEFLRKNNIAKLNSNIELDIRLSNGLNNAGPGGVGRMVMYVKDPARVQFHIPMVHRFLPPQPRNFDVNVPGEYKYSGTEFMLPKSALYVDGVSGVNGV